MRRLHLWIAISGFLVFCATGAVMRMSFDEETPLAIRAFARSRHIYILLSTLVHGALAAYVRPSRRAKTQTTGSALTLVATTGLVVAFFVEQDEPMLRSWVSQLSLFALVGGVVLHVRAGASTPS